MAKTRMVNTRFWSDSFVVELNPLDRYLFLYFLTNEHTNISGVYELPLKRMANETGLDADMLPKMIRRLRGKVFYYKGWVGIKNFQKHQSTTSETVKRGIEVEMAKIPLEIRTKLDSLYGTDTLSDPIIYLNLNSNLNSNPKEPSKSAGVAEIIKLFEDINPNASEWYGNKTQRSAVIFLLEKFGEEKLTQLVKKLPAITSKKFAPKITSPYELKRDLAKLKIFIEQEKKVTTGRGLV